MANAHVNMNFNAFLEKTKLKDDGSNYSDWVRNLRIILIATPFFMSNYTFTAFARNDGAPSTAMIGSICGSMFNIVFDYIFMFPAGLGFSGAALATAVCPTVTMAICTTHYRSHKNHVGFRWKKPSFSHLISCCQLGVSAFVGEMSSGVTAIVFNFLILGIAGNVGVLWSRSKPRHRSSSHLQRSRSRRPATDE